MNLAALSKKLGLSQTTISRALSGYPEVSEGTRRRVQEAAIAHNYSPNTRARRLATGRSMAIGHVIPLAAHHETVNPIFTDFLAGAGEAYSAAGYDLSLSLVQDQEEEDLYREIARRGTVDGVIVHAPKVDDGRVDLLTQLGLPFVVHGRATNAREPYSWVDVNNRRAAETATDHLIDAGHRRIGLINGLDCMDFAVRRRDGYIAALANRGIPIIDEFMAHGEMTERHGHQRALCMLTGRTPPTAFVVASIISAIGVRRAASELGLTVGHDVSIVIYDDDLSYFQNSSEAPIYTCVRSSVRQAGVEAATMLLDIIRGKRDAPQYKLLEAELISGQSTGPAPARQRTLQRG